jgi:hypothetical protein
MSILNAMQASNKYSFDKNYGTEEEVEKAMRKMMESISRLNEDDLSKFVNLHFQNKEPPKI